MLKSTQYGLMPQNICYKKVKVFENLLFWKCFFICVICVTQPNRNGVPIIHLCWLHVYIFHQVPANHLLSASIMSAPAALAMAKLFWPETKKTKSKAEDVYNMKKGYVAYVFMCVCVRACVRACVFKFRISCTS